MITASFEDLYFVKRSIGYRAIWPLSSSSESVCAGCDICSMNTLFQAICKYWDMLWIQTSYFIVFTDVNTLGVLDVIVGIISD